MKRRASDSCPSRYYSLGSQLPSPHSRRDRSRPSSQRADLIHSTSLPEREIQLDPVVQLPQHLHRLICRGSALSRDPQFPPFARQVFLKTLISRTTQFNRPKSRLQHQRNHRVTPQTLQRRMPCISRELRPGVFWHPPPGADVARGSDGFPPFSRIPPNPSAADTPIEHIQPKIPYK